MDMKRTVPILGALSTSVDSMRRDSSASFKMNLRISALFKPPPDRLGIL
jgi:hypothetical protein